MILTPNLFLFMLVAVNRFIDEGLNIAGQLRTALTTGTKMVAILLVIGAATKLCKAVAETVIASPKIRERSLDASPVRIVLGAHLDSISEKRDPDVLPRQEPDKRARHRGATIVTDDLHAEV